MVSTRGEGAGLARYQSSESQFPVTISAHSTTQIRREAKSACTQHKEAGNRVSKEGHCRESAPACLVLTKVFIWACTSRGVKVNLFGAGERLRG